MFRDWGPQTWSALGLVGLGIVVGTTGATQIPVATVVLAIDAAVIVVGLLAWWTLGRDPVELDDDSILAAGPPAGLRPCLAVVMHDGRGEPRALSVALLELAERGFIRIHDDPYVGNGAYIPRAWIDVRSLSRHRGIDLAGPELVLATALGVDRRRSARLDSIDVVGAIGSVRRDFDAAVDGELVAAGWYRRAPFRTEEDWTHVAEMAIAAGAFGTFVAIVSTSVPLLIGYVGLVVAGLVGRRIARAMPVRTRAGARMTAMLTAYRRSLDQTLAMAGSVWDVLQARDLAWFETPDRMIVWAMALDLEDELAALFARAAARSGDRSADDVWFPDWYGTTVRDAESMFRSFDHLTGGAVSIPT